tara:strand:+ start:4183 stop:4551 length:369 start_codon:yes stop_codon:yes gene_type:complete
MSSNKESKPWFEKNGPTVEYVRSDIVNKYKGTLIKTETDYTEMKKIVLDNTPIESITFSSFKEYKLFYTNKNNKIIQRILKEYNMYLCEKLGAYKNHVSELLMDINDDIIILNNFDVWNSKK